MSKRRKRERDIKGKQLPTAPRGGSWAHFPSFVREWWRENFIISTQTLLYAWRKAHASTIDECLFPPNGCTSKTHPITIRNQNRVHTGIYVE